MDRTILFFNSVLSLSLNRSLAIAGSQTGSGIGQMIFTPSLAWFLSNRTVASKGVGGAEALPVFGQTVNPISTGGTDYAHYNTTSPPGFSDLATALTYNWKDAFGVFAALIFICLPFIFLFKEDEPKFLKKVKAYIKLIESNYNVEANVCENKEDAENEHNFWSQSYSFLKKASFWLCGISRFLSDLGGFVPLLYGVDMVNAMAKHYGIKLKVAGYLLPIYGKCLLI